ncbi:MAG: amidohydrolase family protein [Novosphingobium sp.]
MKHALAALAALTIMFLAPHHPALADTLIENVNGITIDEKGTVSRFTGLIFDRDGRIVRVLHGSEKRPKKVDYRIDGEGRTMLPGIIDSHIRLMDTALDLLSAASTSAAANRPPPRAEDMDVALQKTQRQLAARGITALADMGTTIEDWQAFRRAGDAGTLYIRIAAYAEDIAAMALIGGPGPSPWLYGDRLKMNGLALTAERNSALLMDDTRLRNVMSRAAIDSFQVATVAHTPAALAQLAGAVGELSQTYDGERRWRLERPQALFPDDVARLATLGVLVAGDGALLSQPIVNADALHMAWADKQTKGLPAPFPALAAVPQRQRPHALAAMGANGAYAMHAEGRFGRLVPGEWADFILVDRDPLTVTGPELAATQIIETWISGKKIHEQGLETRQQYGKAMPGW